MKYNLDDSLGYLLSRTNTRMKNALLQGLKSYDVTPEQWAVLNRLWEREGVSPKELAELTCKDQPTTVRILNKLENKGFVTRQVNPGDHRAFLIFLTDQGRQLEEQLPPIAERVLQKALMDIDEQQIQELKAILNKIFHNLGVEKGSL